MKNIKKAVFKDLVKRLGKKTLYSTYPSDIKEQLDLKEGDAVELRVIKLRGE